MGNKISLSQDLVGQKTKPQVMGHLWYGKQSIAWSKKKRWCWRYAVLRDRNLNIFKKGAKRLDAAAVMVKSYNVQGAEIVWQSADPKDLRFGLRSKESGVQWLYLMADETSALHMWVNALRDAAQYEDERKLRNLVRQRTVGALLSQSDAQVDAGGGDEAEESVPNKPVLMRRESYQVIDSSQVENAMQDAITSAIDEMEAIAAAENLDEALVTQLRTELTRDRIGAFLKQERWQLKNLMEKFRADPRALLEPVVAEGEGALPPLTDEAETDLFECPSCFGEYPRDQLESLACGHYFCIADCWPEMIGNGIANGSAMTCALSGMNCEEPLPDHFIQRFTTPAVFTKWKRWQTQKFLEEADSVQRCPAPGCSLAVKYKPHAVANISCLCGHNFCFSCVKEPHAPALCEMAKTWRDVFGDDTLSAEGGQERATGVAGQKKSEDWENNRPCPNCKRVIYRESGCNHMTCFMHAGGCGFEFCWICLAPYHNHSEGSCDPVLGAQRIESIVGKPKAGNQMAEQRNQLLPNHQRFFRNFLAQKASAQFAQRSSEQLQNMIKKLEQRKEKIVLKKMKNPRHKKSRKTSMPTTFDGPKTAVRRTRAGSSPPAVARKAATDPTATDPGKHDALDALDRTTTTTTEPDKDDVLDVIHGTSHALEVMRTVCALVKRSRMSCAWTYVLMYYIKHRESPLAKLLHSAKNFLVNAVEALQKFVETPKETARIMLRAGNIEAVHLLLSGPFGTEHSVTDPSATIQEVRVLQAALRKLRHLSFRVGRTGLFEKDSDDEDDAVVEQKQQVNDAPPPLPNFSATPWQCPACTYFNDPDNNPDSLAACEICHTPRVEQPVENDVPLQWACQVCTFFNTGSFSHCMVCSAPYRPPSPTPDTTAASASASASSASASAASAAASVGADDVASGPQAASADANAQPKTDDDALAAAAAAMLSTFRANAEFANGLEINPGDETKTQNIAPAVAATDQTAGDEPGPTVTSEEEPGTKTVAGGGDGGGGDGAAAAAGDGAAGAGDGGAAAPPLPPTDQQSPDPTPASQALTIELAGSEQDQLMQRGRLILMDQHLHPLRLSMSLGPAIERGLHCLACGKRHRVDQAIFVCAIGCKVEEVSICGHCVLLQQRQRLDAKIAKEQAIEALRYWKCHVCFHVNQPERDHCAMCNEQRVVFTEDQKLQKELESDFTFFNMSSLTRGESNI